MGSKRRIWKHIALIILSGRKESQYYIEPFCGGCNSIARVNGNRIASDINPYLISMWKGLLNGEKYSKTITRETYDEAWEAYKAKDYTTYSMAELGWIGFVVSYNGMFYHSYSGVSIADGRDYVKESIARQILPMQGCELHSFAYDALEIPPCSIIYCEPLYRGTKGYGVDFDYPKWYG